MLFLLTDPFCNSCSPEMPILRMASEILWFHLPKILFSSLQLKLIGTAQRWAQKNAKHKKLLNLLCIVYLKHNAQLLWCHWNWLLRYFEYIAEFSFSKILSIFVWQDGLKHAEPNIDKIFKTPNIDKIFKTNIIFITKYLNLNCNSVKLFF